MSRLDNSNSMNREDINGDDENLKAVDASKNSISRVLESKVRCVCGAKHQIDRLKRDLERKAQALERERQYVRQKQEDVMLKHQKLSESKKENMVQQGELDSYKTYLQEKQDNICRMYKMYESGLSDLMQKMDECMEFEKECKKKLSEYQSALDNIKEREHNISETTGVITARKEELQRIESRMLHESERIKHVQEQCAAARDKMYAEMRQHNQKIADEMDMLETKKSKLLEFENQLHRNRDAIEESLHVKTVEIDRKLKELTDAVEYNSSLADELKKRDEVLKREKEIIKEEWTKIKDALDEINEGKIQVCNMKKSLIKRSRQLEASDRQSMTASVDRRSRNVEDIYQRDQTFSDLRSKHAELNDYASHLNKRERELDKLQQSLNKKEIELNKRERELDDKGKYYKQLEEENNEFKHKMELLIIEKKGLEAQIEQFNLKRINKEQELDATRQRLEKKERELNQKFNQLKYQQEHLNLGNKLKSIKSAKTISSRVNNKVLSIANDDGTEYTK